VKRLHLAIVSGLLLCLASGALASSAQAFHTGALFAAAPGAGGGGGYFYTGSPRERGWTCSSCHVDPARALRVSITSVEGLFSSRRYTPDTTYTVTVRMENETLGLGASRSNFNGMALTVLDGEGSPAGTLGGFDAARFFARGTSILASSSTVVGETEWTFTWTAPPGGTGRVTFYLGVVDGDGAGSGPTETLTDPFGDDVAVGRVVLDEE
jgi:Reeler domain